MLQLQVDSKNTFVVSSDNDTTTLNDKIVSWDAQIQPNGLISILYNGKSYAASVVKLDPKAKEVILQIEGSNYTVAIQEPIDQLLSSMGLDLKAMQKSEPLKAPMPGLILKVLVSEGQKVEKGDGLLILEAMKMENVLKASAAGTVKSIKAEPGKAVEKGVVLIEME